MPINEPKNCEPIGLGVISGWLPAYIISKTEPVEVAKGSFGKKNKMIFSRFFIIFQNIITIILLVASITMTSQTLHLIHAPLGYNTINIMDISIGNFNGRESRSLFLDELRQLASVKRVGFAAGTPFNRGNNLTMEHDGKNISCQLLVGDTAVFEMLGFQKIRENNLASFEKTDDFWSNLGNVYPNQQAMKEIELSEDAPRFISWPIAGIIQDFQISNITHAQVPVLFFYYTPELLQHYSPWNILVEIQGNPLMAYKQIQQIHERITKVDFEGKFIDKQVEESFAAQIKVSRIIILFSVIAVLIALLGLLAMSTYFIRQRTAEIAIRKVHGAESFEVLSKLVRTFLAYVLIAFAIAVPVAWYIMRNWLDDYSYRIRLSPLIFIAAGGFCFLIAFIAVYWQSRIAANANPVKSLKSE